MDFKEGNPALSQGLDNATAILSLICLVAMVLGAIGVAMAMHAHLEQRMDMLAILKAVGARSSDLLRIFLLQTLGPWACRRLARCRSRRRRDGGAAGCFRQIAARACRARFSMALGSGWSRNRFADNAALLPAAVARCARGTARAGVAPAGGTGAPGFRALARALVGASIAIGHFGACDVRAGRNRVGALRLGQGRRMVRAAVYELRSLSFLILAAVALARLRFAVESGSPASALVAAPRPGESLPAGEPIGSSARFARHRCDADSRRLSDAGLVAARYSRDRFTQAAQCISDRCYAVTKLQAFVTSSSINQGVTQELDLLPVVTGHFVSLNGKTLDQLKDSIFLGACSRMPN